MCVRNRKGQASATLTPRDRKRARQKYVSLSWLELDAIRRHALARLAAIGNPTQGSPNRGPLRREIRELSRDLVAIDQACQFVPRPGPGPLPALPAASSPYAAQTAMAEHWREQQ